MNILSCATFVVFCLGTYSICAQKHHCINPNYRTGICVPIEDCQTLWSVLHRKPLDLEHEHFLYASQCQKSDGESDFLVCCSSDTGFLNLQPKYDESIYWSYASPYNQRKYKLFGISMLPQNGFKFDTGELEQNEKRDQITVYNKEVNRYRNEANSSLLPQPPYCGSVAFRNRIYGGTNADIDEFPWMVLLEYQRKEGGITVDCAGTLINNRYVLTAAHCLKGRIESNRRLVAVRLGEHDTSINCPMHLCTSTVYRVYIEEVISHNLYDYHNHDNDIALIRLTKSIKFSDNVRPICLPQKEKTMNIKQGTQFTVAGWGQTLKEPNSSVKQKLKVQLVDQEKCKNIFLEKKVVIKDTQICAGGKFLEDSCKGDSGGPLMRVRDNVWVLEGIISFGNGCGHINWPAVHTKVSSYIIWIESQIRT